MPRGCPAFLLLLALAWVLPAATAATRRELEYARVGDQVLRLDLHLPAANGTPAPLVVWVHGGAWSRGSRSEHPLAPLVAQGWAVASVD
jgi:acetyl esterase/lipase